MLFEGDTHCYSPSVPAGSGPIADDKPEPSKSPCPLHFKFPCTRCAKQSIRNAVCTSTEAAKSKAAQRTFDPPLRCHRRIILRGPLDGREFGKYHNHGTKMNFLTIMQSLAYRQERCQVLGFAFFRSEVEFCLHTSSPLSSPWRTAPQRRKTSTRSRAGTQKGP